MAQRPQHFTIDYSHPLARGLVFAGLGNAAGSVRYWDSSSRKNNGTLTSMDPPTDWCWVPELGRWGLDFDGSNDYVSLPRVIDLGITNCISAWVSLDTSNQYQNLVNDGDAIYDFSLRVRHGDSIQYAPTGGASTDAWAFAHPNNTLFHLAINRTSATSATAYINGVSIGTKGKADWSGKSTLADNISYHAAVYRLTGKCVDLLFHSRALTLPEIRAIANPSDPMLGGMIKPIGQASNIYNLEGIR